MKLKQIGPNTDKMFFFSIQGYFFLLTEDTYLGARSIGRRCNWQN